VMVGDTAYDMMMARSARAVGLGVSWGYHAIAELKGAGARLVIDDFENLAEIAAQLIGAAECA
jgi:phosphoglycolate phosphatase